ncbi:MAG: RsmB/NOP family class I SAM-dependent RNA methyltransferase [Candidatus Bathyarchaeota archaeon]|nr:RsmB/NOP family class I SAM-dependent RNA methyltransferase [Candidatus Bathyarchaeota archaeon]MDH5754493.1 RsmB/NOP family class I SAM-dependent RNA methyltransferase [Candidatus Bathyarchaeota archaeon]
MLAIETLSWMEMQKLSERLALARTVKQLGISDPNAVRLAHRLVVETVRRRNFIDKFINNVLKPDAISEFNLGVQAFLRLYVYKTRIAKNWPKIDIEEAENIAKLARSILGWKTLQKVEHVLGLLLTQKPTSTLKGAGDEERIGLLTFHPTWFVRYCFKLLGRKEAIAMLEADMQPSPTYIRLNMLKMAENEILGKLAEDGIKVEKIGQLRHTYKIVGVKQPLTRTESFREGLFYIQDKASCFAAEAAKPKPGMTLLDVCAAPGAKTTYLAQLMQNKGVIYSIDYSKRRMNVWKKEVARMGVKIAMPIIVDACNPLPLGIKADIVVLDPPCTSTGAFRKLPSAKWRLTRRSVDKMADIQWQMINNCAENVESGGALIYSTCSITVEENEMLVERFLKGHPEFSLAEITPKIGLPGLRGLEKCQRLYPHIHQCNGFFIAKLLKE